MADLAVSLHRLLRARSTVVWHWLPLTAALLVLLLILNFWWTFYAIGLLEVWRSYFWVLFGAFILLASAVSLVSLSGGSTADLAVGILPNLVLAGVCFVFARIRALVVHAAAIALLLAVMMMQWSKLQLVQL